jgi:hypothetical protein
VKNQTPFAAAGKAGKYKLIASRNAQQISTPVDVTQLAAPRSHSGLLTRAIDWIRTHQQGRGSTKRLQVAATASFGDKRFVAVIRVDGREFLVGWGATNVALLAQLNERESFGDLLHASVTASNEQNIDPGMQLTSVQA